MSVLLSSLHSVCSLCLCFPQVLCLPGLTVPSALISTVWYPSYYRALHESTGSGIRGDVLLFPLHLISRARSIQSIAALRVVVKPYQFMCAQLLNMLRCSEC